MRALKKEYEASLAQAAAVAGSLTVLMEELHRAPVSTDQLRTQSLTGDSIALTRLAGKHKSWAEYARKDADAKHDELIKVGQQLLDHWKEKFGKSKRPHPAPAPAAASLPAELLAAAGGGHQQQQEQEGAAAALKK